MNHHKLPTIILVFVICLGLVLSTNVQALAQTGPDGQDTARLPNPPLPNGVENPDPKTLPPLPEFEPRWSGPSETIASPNLALADSSVKPDLITARLSPEQSQTAQVQVFTGDIPIGKGDIVFVLDRTGSMYDEIAEAKESAIEIMNGVRSELPNSWFGVGSFMDYPGFFAYPGYADIYGEASYGDLPWIPGSDPTETIKTVADIIQGFSLGNGVDTPESYTRVLYEVTKLKWRQASKKIVVLFGDAPTHDLSFAGYNFGGDPGLNGIALDSDDLVFDQVVRQVRDQGISVIAVDSSGGYETTVATFKGMSTGYASSPGTNGQYYQLGNASEISEAVVNLIAQETRKINLLRAVVTPGYESWVSFPQDSYSNVLPNTTRNFDLTLRVPKGTAPGFYPFMIQIIADDTLFGVSYVEVEVPSDTTRTDLGFNPQQDGFGFGNFGKTNFLGLPEKWYTQLSWEMFRQFFGATQVEYPNGNHIKAADEYFKAEKGYANIGAGGHCDGMAAASLLNFKGWDKPNAGRFALAHSESLVNLSLNEGVRDALNFAQGIQGGLEIALYRGAICESVGNSPKAFYRMIKNHIQNNSPVVLGIRKGDGGHALVPYKYEEPSDKLAYVYVYDSNHPKDSGRRVEFDLEHDRWKYVFLNLWILNLDTWEGDSSGCNMNINPLDMYRHPGVAWWAGASAAASGSLTAAADPEQTLVFGSTGPARPLFIDDSGRRLGWQGDTFYDEIPGATYIPLASGFEPHGYYYIPDDMYYTLQVTGSGLGEASLSLWGKGFLAQFSHIQMNTGMNFGLSVSPDGKNLTIEGITGEVQGTLTLDRLLAGEDRAVSVGKIVVAPGEQVTLSLGADEDESLADQIKLITNSGQERHVDLSLQRAGGEGYKSYGRANILLDASSNSSASIMDWTKLDSLTIDVDLDQDGVAEKSQSYPNQAVPAAIEILPSKPFVRTGGETVTLTIAVMDQFAAYAADGTPVTLSTSLGTLSTTRLKTVGGFATVTLKSGATAGKATISAKVDGASVEQKVDIFFENYTHYLPITTRSR